MEGKIVEGKVVVPFDNTLYQRFYGIKKDKEIELSFVEAIYLLEKGKIKVKYNGNYINEKDLINYAKKYDNRISIRYKVYKDLRDKGYIVKTALKYGADYRVYDKGNQPGKDHSKWLVYCVYEGETFNWREFVAKNRVAHSVRKKLLIAIVDDESDITYYEVSWKKM